MSLIVAGLNCLFKQAERLKVAKEDLRSIGSVVNGLDGR